MFGLSHADVNQSYNTIQFGLYLANNGRLEVWESGSPRGGVGTYAAGDKLRVSVDSGVVTYRKNETTVLYTSTLPAPTNSLFADTALYTNGATLGNAVISGSGGCPGAAFEITYAFYLDRHDSLKVRVDLSARVGWLDRSNEYRRRFGW